MKNKQKTIAILISCLLFVSLIAQVAHLAAYPQPSPPSVQVRRAALPGSGSLDETDPSTSSSVGSSLPGEDSSASFEDSSVSDSSTSEESSSLLPGDGSVGVAPTSAPQVSLNFSDIYSGSAVKSYSELLSENLIFADTTEITLTFNLTDPTVFPGISGLPANVTLDIIVPGTYTTSDAPYLAIGPGAKVNAITGGTGEGDYIGAIVVMGIADSITISQGSNISSEVAITGESGNYSWVSDQSPVDTRPATVTGVVVGAYDGGVINGDIVFEGQTQMTGHNIGFLGVMVGAYRNARVGNIILGDEIYIDGGYIQSVIGANENSTAGNISIGVQYNLYYYHAEYTAVGASSGHLDSQRKPSSVGVISLRQHGYITENYIGTDNLSNVCIGAERGSSAAQIRIEETLEWVSDPNHGYQILFIGSSSKVTIGAYDGATIGTSATSDAIVLRYTSVWDSSYSSGSLLMGALKNSTINGNISIFVSGITSSYGDADPYIAVIGTGENSHVTGTILLHAAVYASSWANPPTIIGPCDATSSVHEIKVEKFASIRSWDYDPFNYSIFGAPGARLDRIWIDGDLLIQMPKNTYSPNNPGAVGADFIANEILITNGNIIGQDISIKFDGTPGGPTELYRNDPNRENMVPPWVHSDIKMSVLPKNQLGETLASYAVISPGLLLENQLMQPTSHPITVYSNSGSAYTYRFGNDLRNYLALMYGIDSGLGSLRPSWVPDIYPLWYYDGMELDAPFVHFVYLPASSLTPLAYSPSNQNGQIDTSESTISVQLSLPLSLAYLAANGNEPLVKITNAATGAQVAAFALNDANYAKFFTLVNAQGVTGTSGNTLVLQLNQIHSFQKDTIYAVTIEQNALSAEFATTQGLSILDASVQNNLPISWRFRIPSALPPSTSVPSPPPQPIPPPPSPLPSSSSSSSSSSSPATTSSSSSASSSATTSSASSLPQSTASNSSNPVISLPESDTSGPPPTPSQRREETRQQLIDAGVPALQLGNTRVPLSGRNNLPVWSLFNLILTIIGVGAALTIGILYLIRRRQALDKETGRLTEKSKATTLLKDKDFLLGAGIGAGALMLIFFIVTQDMHKLMVIFDGWSILMAALAAAETLLFVLALKKEPASEAPLPDEH